MSRIRVLFTISNLLYEYGRNCDRVRTIASMSSVGYLSEWLLTVEGEQKVPGGRIFHLVVNDNEVSLGMQQTTAPSRILYESSHNLAVHRASQQLRH